MLAVALIVFRELIEAALIVTILLAATCGVARRGSWIGGGVAAGLGGAFLIAALITEISSLFQGVGQELVSAAILFSAVLLIGWHVIWMNVHGRELAKNVKLKAQNVSEGSSHMSALALVTGLAVMREGSEVVLMLQGLYASGAAHDMFGGIVAGTAAGLSLSYLMYRGFVALPVSRVFALTNVLLVLIASGMAARGANLLVQAGFLPSLGNSMWNSDSIISESSLVGSVLSALIGYIAQPSASRFCFMPSPPASS